MSPLHFQRVFKEWAGITPKHFLQYLNVKCAGCILCEIHASLFSAVQGMGLSDTGQLHDLFITVEGMTPGEYENGGENLSINYSFTATPFNDILIASALKGICSMEFADDRMETFSSLQRKFPHARLRQTLNNIQQSALFIFTQDWSRLDEIKLHLKGMEFQMKVWEALLKIPMGGMTTYGNITTSIDNSRTCHTVGTAVGENPVAFLIPCYRVIRATGEIGNYRQGEIRKTVIIGWETAKRKPEEWSIR